MEGKHGPMEIEPHRMTAHPMPPESPFGRNTNSLLRQWPTNKMTEIK